jgi:hypothetical protein
VNQGAGGVAARARCAAPGRKLDTQTARCARSPALRAGRSPAASPYLCVGTPGASESEVQTKRVVECCHQRARDNAELLANPLD